MFRIEKISTTHKNTHMTSKVNFCLGFEAINHGGILGNDDSKEGHYL